MEKKTGRFIIRVSPEWLERLDAWRNGTSRSEAVRDLVVRGIDADSSDHQRAQAEIRARQV